MEHFNNGFNLIDKAHIDTVKQRFLRISDAIEKSYYSDGIKGEHSHFVGSYGRNTAINTSDIDIMVVLPESVYDQFDSHSGNSASHLLQAIRADILETYPKTDISGDGQVVVIEFTDGMKFEVLPGFKRGNDAYYHPDTHDGGSWKLTYPFLEQTAMRKKNSQCNGLLYDTCRYIRYIRDECFEDMNLSGIVIDSFVYSAIGPYRWQSTEIRNNSNLYSYIEHLYEAYSVLNESEFDVLYAPGSDVLIPFNDSFDNLGKVINRWLDSSKNNY